MEIKAVKFNEKGFMTQPFALGGEDGMEKFDAKVRYRSCLQNYLIDTGDEVARIFKDVRDKVLSHEWALQMHGFHVDVPAKEMRFDVVMSFDIRPQEGIEILRREIGEAYPDYDLLIIPDVDVAD